MGTLPNIENNITEHTTMKLRIFSTINAIIIMPVLLFWGCGEPTSSNQKDEGNNASKGIIGVSVLTLGNPFFSVIFASILEKNPKTKDFVKSSI